MNAVFFTDLDGTLLDHENYCYDESLQGIKLLKEKMVPLVPVSSKTFDEISLLAGKLGLDSPFAFENGTGIAYPSEDKKSYNLEIEGPGTVKLAEFLPELERISSKILRGITALSEPEICELTGLDLESAALSKKRLTTLPFIAEGTGLLGDSEIISFNRELESYNLLITRGGRFNHLIPAGSGKGRAVKKIIEFYRHKFNDEIVTGGAGDSMNDIPMLESVDHPYIIRKPGGGYIDFFQGKIMKSSGPAGFSEAVNDFLKITAGK